MEAGTLVLVHLVTPKEKYWGLLEALSPAGLTLRAWGRGDRPRGRRPLHDADVVHGTNYVVPPSGLPSADAELRVTTLFVPLHRVEKIFEDTRVGSVASYAERFFAIVGRDVRDVLRPAPPVSDTTAN